MIYTSYFPKVRELIANRVIPVSICGKAPNNYKGFQYKKLAPKYEFFMEWKKNKDNNYYIEHFNEEVLSKLDADKVIEEINNLINSRHYFGTFPADYDVALICYEKPGEFCHRHLVADWLKNNGYACMEWSDKFNGQGYM